MSIQWKSPDQVLKRNMHRKAKFQYGLTIAFFLLPALIIYGIFNIYGILLTFYYSMQRWTGISEHLVFVGFGNFIKLFQDPLLWHSLSNNLILVVVSILIQLPLGLTLALLIQSGLKGMKFYRTIFFIPMLISTVAIGILWSLIYNPNFGIINSLLDALKLSQFKMGWLGSEKTAFIAVLITICWQFTPFYMILMRAGLVGIPGELYESAFIDGANEWEAFRHITLPLMSGAIKTAAILSLVGSLKYFDLIYTMTDGGPNHATELMSTYMYKNSFVEFNMGYGSSIAAFIFLLAIFITSVVQFSARKAKLGEGRVRSVAKNIGLYCIATLFLVVTGYPLLFVFQSSFKSQMEYMSNIWSLPGTLFLGNYERILQPDFLRYFCNSLIITALTITLVIFIASLAS